MNTDSQALLAPQRASDVPAEREGFDEYGLLRRLLVAQSEIVRAALDRCRVVAVVTHHARELTRSGGAAVEIAGSELVYGSASGDARACARLRVGMKSSLAGLCVATTRALRCDDNEVDPRVDRDVARRTGSNSALAVPLPCADPVVDVPEVMSPTPAKYGPNDVRIVELPGASIGNTLEHAVHHASIEATAAPGARAGSSTMRRLRARHLGIPQGHGYYQGHPLAGAT